jgi:uncharacterized integral membrane protein
VSFRLNVLVVAAIFIALMFLINNHPVQVQILFYSTSFSLGGIMAGCFAAGIGATYLFISLTKSFRRITSRLKKGTGG